MRQRGLVGTVPATGSCGGVDNGLGMTAGGVATAGFNAR